MLAPNSRSFETEPIGYCRAAAIANPWGEMSGAGAAAAQAVGQWRRADGIRSCPRPVGREGHAQAAERRATGARPLEYELVARANPIAVGIVAAAAAVIGPSRSRTYSSRADRCRTIASTIPVAAITVATAAHCDRATPSASNRNRAAAVTTTVEATTAPIGTTAATASIGIVRDQAGGE